MQLDFFNKKFSEDTVLERAQKYARRDPLLQQVIQMLYFDPYAKDEDIASALSQGQNIVDASRVKLQLRPRAQQLIDQERAKNNTAPALPKPGTSQEGTETETLPSIDALEAQAVSIVMSAHSGVTLNAKIKQKVIFLFKTFAPLAVLCLTIPESYWVFTHIYSGEFTTDELLHVLTGVFAVLTDFGYLYLTILLEMNKEAMFKRRRAGLAVEKHEENAVNIQSWLWWAVALMDVFAQFIFLYSATQGSTFMNNPTIVIALAGIRVFSLFTTMFVVSFAGTELMTDVDVVANEQVERAEKVARVMTGFGVARDKQMKARIALENMMADQDLRREGESFLKEMYKDAREDAKRLREEMRRRRDDDGQAGAGVPKKKI
jgi:hypothetical protein